MTCLDCTKQHTYNLHCPECCARMVEHARPSKVRQIAVMDRTGIRYKQDKDTGSPENEKRIKNKF